MFRTILNTSHGVRQGGILSPNLFCFYMNDLLTHLRHARTGCHGLCGQPPVLVPQQGGVARLQELLSIAERYAADHKTSFSTHHLQAKGLVFSKKELS